MEIQEIGKKDPTDGLKATGSRIIARDTTNYGEGKTKSGLIVPESSQTRDFNGVAIDIGPDADQRIKKGTSLIFQVAGAIKVCPESLDNIISIPMGNIVAFWEDEED